MFGLKWVSKHKVHHKVIKGDPKMWSSWYDQGLEEKIVKNERIKNGRASKEKEKIW